MTKSISYTKILNSCKPVTDEVDEYIEDNDEEPDDVGGKMEDSDEEQDDV